MTSLEHISVEHAPALNRLPSWIGARDGDEEGGVAEVREEGEVRDEIQEGDEMEEVEIEEVGVGLAVTTPEDDDEVGIIIIGDEQDQYSGQYPRQRIQNKREDDGEGRHHHEEGDRAQAEGSAESVACHAASPSSRRAGLASRLASRSNSNSNSGFGSGSLSHSRSCSHSRSRSSLKRALEMGESSSATSWTHADVKGVGVGPERPSGDSGRRRRPSDEVRCRADERVSKEEGVDVKIDVETGEEVRSGSPRKEVEVVSLSRLSRSKNADGGEGEEGVDVNVSKKEVVLIAQEEDIGEGWHPLEHHSKAPVQSEGEGEKVVEEEDVGSVHALESVHGGDRSSETNEKERWRSFGRSGRHLRLEFKRASPQPWDDVDAAPTVHNDMGTSDYYSTLNSKKFETMQKSRRRPLIPHSSYYFGPPPVDSAYGTPPVGQIGVHHPREIVRIERDYVGGELVQFSPVFPLELEGRITPTQFHQTINDINEILISAHSIQHSFVDNILAVLTLQLSTLILSSHYTKEMRRLKRKFEELNTQLYNPVGLHILWPQKVAFLFLEIEYY